MTMHLDLGDLEMLACDCLTRAGVGEPEARAVARDVALAECFGERDAGFPALLRDIRLIRYGRLHPEAPTRITAPAPAVLRVDAGHGFAAAAVLRARDRLRDTARREGMALIHLTRASDPGALAGTLLDLAAAGLAAVVSRPQGQGYAIAPGAVQIAALGGGVPGLMDTFLSLAPPADDSPLDGPVSCSGWVVALDPEATAAGDLLARLPARGTDMASGIAVASDLLAQIVNA